MAEIKFRINYCVNDKEFILEMIARYLFNTPYKRKADFLKYFKDQVEKFGMNFTSQFGENEHDLSEAKIYYRKWFPTEEEKRKDQDFYNNKNYYKSAMKIKGN